jgi:hypothetical protein
VEWAALVAWVATALGGATLAVSWLGHGGHRQPEGIEPAPAEGEQALPDASAEPKPVSEPEAAAAEGEQPLADPPAQPESESESEPAPAEGDQPLPDDAPAEPETGAPDGPRNSVR